MIWFFLLALLFFIPAVILILRENAATKDNATRVGNIGIIITGVACLLMMLVMVLVLPY